MTAIQRSGELRQYLKPKITFTGDLSYRTSPALQLRDFQQLHQVRLEGVGQRLHLLEYIEWGNMGIEWGNMGIELAMFEEGLVAYWEVSGMVLEGLAIVLFDT